MKLPPGLAPLRERDFALYWYGQTTSQIGTWAELTTTSWLLYDLTSSPLLLGLNGIFRAAPVLLLSLLGGAVADRVPRKRLILITLTAEALVAFALGALVVTGAVRFWHLYIATAVTGTLVSFEQPARLAMYPSLVSRAQLQNAVMLHAVIHRSSTLIGPAIGGLLIARFGIAVPYFVNAASFVAILLALLAIHVPDHAVRIRASVAREVLDGLRYVGRHRVLPALFLAEIAVSLFGHNSALVTIYARDVLHVDAQGLGIMLGAVGAGALVGVAVLLATGDVRRKGALMLGGGLAYAATLLAFGNAPAFVVAVVALLLVGLADSMWGSMRNTIMQTAIADAYRGRVMSLNIIVPRGLTNLSHLQTGIAVSLFGPPGAVLLGGAVIAAVVAGTAARSRELRGYETATLAVDADAEPSVASSRYTTLS